MTIELVLFELDLGRDEIEALAALLGPGERAQACAYRAERDRRRFIARRGQLRLLLSERVRVAPHALAFRTNAWGKPVLAAAQDIRFSLSASGELALCALSRGSEVGCDIERLDPALAQTGVAERFFAPDERKALASLPPEQWLEGFFNCWTRKEAYVKALGLGLSYPLDRFSVSVGPGEPPRLLAAEPGWSVSSFAPETGYQAALVYRSEAVAPVPLVCRRYPRPATAQAA